MIAVLVAIVLVLVFACVLASIAYSQQTRPPRRRSTAIAAGAPRM